MKKTEINIKESFDLYEHYNIKVDQNQSLLRIDKYLIDKLPGVSRKKIQDGIKNGFVKVNDISIKQSYKVKPQDKIIISFPNPPKDNKIIPEDIKLDIQYEDKECLVVNKPAGMVVHPAYQNWSGTLVNALVFHFNNLPEMPNNIGRPGLVHRIDKDTSGLLVIAKTDKSMLSLAKQFFDHTIERSYIALVWGELKEKSGKIDVNLGRSFKDRRVVDSFPNSDFGRKAITYYKVIKSFTYVSLIECRLETGRTHQIRAHMKHLGNPIFNDALYGGNKIIKGTLFNKYKKFIENCFKLIPRQALHAKSLGFVHPKTKKKMFFESEFPDDLKAVISKWENYTIGQGD